MLNRQGTIVTIALGIAFLAACKPQVLTTTQLQTIQVSNDAYLAYERGDCETVRRLADPDRLGSWAFNELRHSTLLLQGFCREIEGNTKGAREIYRQLVLEAPNSFAADDAIERTRILKLIEKDPDYNRWVSQARDRRDPAKPARTPIDRVPVEFPPIAKAAEIDGYVVVEFGITRRGDTENPIVVESDPTLLFDGSAIRAVREWQYMREYSTDDTDRQLIRILFRKDGLSTPAAENATDADAAGAIDATMTQ